MSLATIQDSNPRTTTVVFGLCLLAATIVFYASAVWPAFTSLLSTVWSGESPNLFDAFRGLVMFVPLSLTLFVGAMFLFYGEEWPKLTQDMDSLGIFSPYTWLSVSLVFLLGSFFFFGIYGLTLDGSSPLQIVIAKTVIAVNIVFILQMFSVLFWGGINMALFMATNP